MKKSLSLVAVFAIIALLALLPKLAQSHETVTTTVEFDREIVRILDKHCVMCHVDNGPAFPLVTYEQTYAQRRKMRMDALDRHMSPWAAVSGYGEFANDNSLTQREIDFIVSWAEGWGPRNSGRVYTAAADTQPLPVVVQAHTDFERWQLGKPDLLLSLEPTTIEPQQVFEAKRTIIDTKLPSDRWLRGLEYKPGDRRVAHAAFFTIQETGQWIGSWTPWYGFSGLPSGVAYRVPAGSHIVAEVDYRGAAAEANDRGALGLFFSDRAPQASLSNLVLNPQPEGSATPAGIKFAARIRLAAETNVVALRPEIRPGLSSLEVSAASPLGSTQVLLFARDFDLEWPTPYILKSPKHLAKGTQLTVTEYWAGNGARPSARDIPVSITEYAGAALSLVRPGAPRSEAGLNQAAKRYALTGTVKSVDAGDRTLVVAHGDIPGVMPAMTMQYQAANGEDLKKVSPGDQIRADLVVQGSMMRLEHIQVTGSTKPRQP